MLPDYFIKEQLEKLRRQREETQRPRVEIPVPMSPTEYSYDRPENYRDEEEPKETEYVIKM